MLQNVSLIFIQKIVLTFSSKSPYKALSIRARPGSLGEKEARKLTEE
jgi:hypothetical protein